MRYHYRICGLTVASDLKLDGAWPHLPKPGETPDVVMCRGEVPHSLASPQVARPGWDSDAHNLLLRGEGVGRFLITDGVTVLFEPEEGVLAEECAVYLQGTVIGMLLHQRGAAVLHASSVAVGGKAILFCGISGEGKSTLAANLSTCGYPVVSDDVCLVSFRDDGLPVIIADTRKLKLTEASIEAIGLEEAHSDPARGLTVKSYVTPPARWEQGELPIGAIYFLRSSGAFEIIPLALGEALQSLSRNAHRPGLVRNTGQTARYFQANARILCHAPAFVLSRRRDLAGLGETVAALECHWCEIGLVQQRENGDA